MTPIERLDDGGFEDVLLFSNPSYDDALIGVTTDNRAVYEYNAMVDWLIENDDMSYEDAVEWIDYNTLRALPYYGGAAPIVIFEV